MSRISRLKNRDFYINFDSNQVKTANEVIAEIKSNIYRNLLEYFAENPDTWLNRDRLISNAWPDGAGASNISDGTFFRTIHNVKYIHRTVCESIDSKRGLGYKYLGSRCEEFDPDGDDSRPPAPPLHSAPHAVSDDQEAIYYAAQMIHQNTGRKIDESLEIAIGDVIASLISEIGESVWCEFTWAEKTAHIVSAYDAEQLRIVSNLLSGPTLHK